MGQPLRGSLVLLGLLYILVLVVLWLSRQHMVTTNRLFASYDENHYLYHLYLVDSRYNLRVDITGTDCDFGPPSWAAEPSRDANLIVMRDRDGLFLAHRLPYRVRCRL